MKQTFLGAVSALALVAAYQPASAADVALKAPARQAEAPNQWYVSAFGGWAKADDYKFTFVDNTTGRPFAYQVSLHDGYIFGGAIGRELSKNIRVEIEAAHSRFKFGDDYHSLSGGFIGLGETGSLGVTTVMANIWGNLWDKPGTVTPYAGFGTGVGIVEGKLTVTNGAGAQLNGNETGWAWQAGGGLRLAIANNVEVDVGWRVHHVHDIAIPSAIVGFHTDRKSTRLNSSHIQKSRMPSSA